MSKVNTSRRKFLVDASAATCGAGLAVAGVDPSASRSARDTLRIEEWRPDGRYEPGSLVRTLHGDVLIGDFEEVLSIPGRYLNDHCLVRNRDEWHFFGITGLIPPSLADDSRRAESEISFAHATSSDLKKWKLWPDVIQCSGAWPEVSHVLAPYVVERQGTYYMLYAATDKDTTQRIWPRRTTFFIGTGIAATQSLCPPSHGLAGRDLASTFPMGKVRMAGAATRASFNYPTGDMWPTGHQDCRPSSVKIFAASPPLCPQT
jgi:hypothetical protein